MRMKIRKYLTFLLLLSIVFGISSCRDSLRRHWTEEGFNGKYFSNILVVGISNQTREREFFESYTTDLFEFNGYKSMLSHYIMPHQMELNDSIFQSLIAKYKVDGVLVIAQNSDEGTFPATETHKKLGKFYAQRHYKMHAPSFTTFEKPIMEALFYDFTNPELGQLVWRGEMPIIKADNQELKERFLNRMVNHLIETGIILNTKAQALFSGS